MQKRKNRLVRDPYYHWKALNMILAFAILILAFLVLTGREEKYLIPAACSLGAVMCALSGICLLYTSEGGLAVTVVLLAGTAFLLWKHPAREPRREMEL